jgi:kynurenine formamidase
MKYVDLSYKIGNDSPVYPGDIKVSLIQTKELSKDTYNAYYFMSGLHVGTHIDCPIHLLQDDHTIAEYPIECFVGNGYLIDVRGKKKIEYKAEYDNSIQKEDIVLINTGMDNIYGKESYYNNHPYVSEELVNFLVSRKIKMLGIDMPSPNFLPFPIHKLLLGNGVFMLENLTNLKELLGIPYFEVFAQPIRICAEAGLTRAFARYNGS